MYFLPNVVRYHVAAAVIENVLDNCLLLTPQCCLVCYKLRVLIHVQDLYIRLLYLY